VTALRLALVGAPNCGKSTLFNGLTGGRAKVANYPGATVETRSGRFVTPHGRAVELIDLPGFYGLTPRSLDERVAIEALTGKPDGAPPPDMLLVLIDAANIRTHLHSVLQIAALGRPMMVVLNMIDLATRDGLEIDIAKLEERLGVPRKQGRSALLARLDAELERVHKKCERFLDSNTRPLKNPDCVLDSTKSERSLESAFHKAPAARANMPASDDLKTLQRQAREIARAVIIHEPALNRATRIIDNAVLHPVAGPFILASILFFMFQAVFSWSAAPMEAMDAGAVALGRFVAGAMPQGWLNDLLVNGVIAGVGSVVIFLPQIIILFAFILVLEASGYMARAAFLLDDLMMRVGLNGRAFIPLLSSFACAIPGIMAARVIESERDRLTTILIAPLMTCSARLPIYALIIAAFIPPDRVGLFNLQGLVMFGLYLAGVVSAVTVAFILKRTVTKGRPQPLIMELPTYKLPNFRDFFVGLTTRASAFLKRAGTIILATSIALWFLASYPASATSLRESFAGRIGSVLETILAPIGFNLEIAIALVPGMAAREVAVGALGTVYAVQGGDENVEGLSAMLQSAWSLPTALAFLAWYVFAPQCFATLATIRRETNSWKWMGFTLVYLFALAYIAAGIVYWTASAAGL